MPWCQNVYLDKVFDIFEVADFLGIDLILEPCTELLLEVMYFYLFIMLVK